MDHTLSLDIETYSETDIGRCGSFRYIEDPAFQIMLLAFAFDNDEVEVVDLMAGDPLPRELTSGLYDPRIIKTGWNNAFERYALRKHLGRYCPPEQWEDTMVLAAQCGLPASLDNAGKALGLSEDQAKMKEGKALIRYFCLPCRPTKTNGGRTRNLPEHAPEKWARFKEYNGQDVVAERGIRNRLLRWKPSEREHRFWCLDARINEKGMRIDRQLAINAVAMDQKYKEELTERAIAITGLENPKSVSQIKSWLFDQEGKEFPSLNKKVIADVVSQLQTTQARDFMAIRSELAKSSTAKYEAMLRSVCPDGHCKGCFQFYHGGSGRRQRAGPPRKVHRAEGPLRRSQQASERTHPHRADPRGGLQVPGFGFLSHRSPRHRMVCRRAVAAGRFRERRRHLLRLGLPDVPRPRGQAR